MKSEKSMSTAVLVLVSTIIVAFCCAALAVLPNVARAEDYDFIGNRVERECRVSVVGDLFVFFIDENGDAFRWDDPSELNVSDHETRIVVFDDLGTSKVEDDVIKGVLPLD